MQFRTLSHAGLEVNAGGKQLLCDPWVLGSAYWRSWWNYPPVPRALVESLKPDFIYLTHLHWDHFQGPSLRLFSPETQILVPYDRYPRMVRDLAAMGFHNVREVRHGERVTLAPGLDIQAYHFSPAVTDSAVVIVAEGVTLVNANDAKLAGLPLRQLVRDHPKIDFCFRSHSSANPRANFHVMGEPYELLDDTEHYVRAFALFIEKVRPRYAIPFASNACFLHEDSWGFNQFAQTPLVARDYFEAFAAERGLDTKIQIMSPGDSWSPETGFTLHPHDYFQNRDVRLAEYRARVQPTLDKQATLEARVKVSLPQMQKYFAKIGSGTPFFLTRGLKGREVLIVSKSGTAEALFAVDLVAGQVRVPAADEVSGFDMRIEIPALVLMQSMTMNMFGHAGISKRVHYHASRAAMPRLKRFVAILEWFEAELLPLGNHFTMRTARAGLRRWREAALYAMVLKDVARGLDMPTIEEKYLQTA